MADGGEGRSDRPIVGFEADDGARPTLVACRDERDADGAPTPPLGAVPASAAPMQSRLSDGTGVAPFGWIGSLLLQGAFIAAVSLVALSAPLPKLPQKNVIRVHVVFERPPPPAPAPRPPAPQPPRHAADPHPAPVLPPRPQVKPAPPRRTHVAHRQQRAVPTLRHRERRSVPPPAHSQAPAPPPPGEQVAIAPRALPVMPPRPVGAGAGNHAPAYPQAALDEQIEGRVVLRVRVSAAGRPLHVSVLRSSGHEILDEAALRAIRRWHFVPATRGGKPVAGTVDVPVRFRLRD